MGAMRLFLRMVLSRTSMMMKKCKRHNSYDEEDKTGAHIYDSDIKMRKKISKMTMLMTKKKSVEENNVDEKQTSLVYHVLVNV